MAAIRAIPLLVLAVMLAACGTATPVQRTSETADEKLRAYTRAVVIPLADATRVEVDEAVEDEQEIDETDLEAYRREVAVAGRAFADALAEELRQRREFREVVVDEVAQPGDLVIGGEVTMLVTGNVALRWAIGILGAGRSGFQATVRLSDAASGEELGTLQAEARSSRIGGTLAAFQSAEVLARDAAVRAAVEVGRARRPER
ncbi:MAG TPA: DUF4410 domain-containing protein [Xanthomonadaceae bacterium]|nr:DUF4410 domain-containing protein [Xanthomonadaceae bacterium]